MKGKLLREKNNLQITNFFSVIIEYFSLIFISYIFCVDIHRV